MSIATKPHAEVGHLISEVAHVLERSGLAMAGAMCGTFVAALLVRANAVMFDSVGFVLSMVLIGMIGFYLGIDVPPWPADIAAERPRMDPVDLLSGTGTFLAAVAALVSVSAIVLDEIPQLVWDLILGSWWVAGVSMQAAAGCLARLRLARRTAA
jgi:hypothetical protein